MKGPVLIGLAAFLWSTDALVRYPAVSSIDPTFIVLVEHLIGFLLLLPWAAIRYKEKFFRLSAREWLAAAFCGIGGSALATIFFTASFLYVNPSVAVLLQKLQPLMVVLFAYLFLGERPARKFYRWGLVALLAGIVLSFPDLKFKFLFHGVDLRSKGIQYAFFAALLWAASTVGGKVLVQKVPPILATFWRFAFGLIALCFLFYLTGNTGSWKALLPNAALVSLLYMSLIPGLLAILTYYSGLAKTPANIATFIELLYPIGAILLNTLILHTPLDPVQTIAGTVLLIAVTFISI
jgi:drug/metabolite transporter (DMT)-like permease